MARSRSLQRFHVRALNPDTPLSGTVVGDAVVSLDSDPDPGSLEAHVAMLRPSRLVCVFALLALPSIAAGCRSSRRAVEQASPPPAATAVAPVVLPARAAGESAGGVSLAAVEPAVRRDALTLATRRAHALDRLIRRGPSAAAAMTALLASKNLDELEGALEWFAAIHPDAATGDIAALATHSSESVRALVVDALVAQDARAQATTLAGLLGDPSPLVRAKAAMALRRFGDASATEALLARVQDSDPLVALEAAHAAAAVGGADAWKALLAEARGGTPSARRAALQGLRRAEQSVPLEVLDAALASDELDLKLEGIKGLRLAVEEAAPTRLGLQLQDRQPVVRRVALETVFATDAKAGTAAARGMLGDGDRQVRAAAVALLAGAAESDLGAAELARLLADPDTGVRAVAAAYAGTRTGDELRAALVGRLAAEAEVPVRRMIVEALGTVGDKSSLDALIAAMDEPRSPVADQALAALQRITGEAIGPDPAAWRAFAAGGAKAVAAPDGAPGTPDGVPPAAEGATVPTPE
jgi:HEAT repeat protein